MSKSGSDSSNVVLCGINDVKWLALAVEIGLPTREALQAYATDQPKE
jgi:hypothetical protein